MRAHLSGLNFLASALTVSKASTMVFNILLKEVNIVRNVIIIFNDLNQRIYRADQISLLYSIENDQEELDVRHIRYKKEVYILGAKNHVVSIVCFENHWLLFNSLPENWGLFFLFFFYALYNAYLLFFRFFVFF